MKLFFIALSGLLLLHGPALSAREETLEQKAARIHKAVLTIDTHTDTPWRFGHPSFDLGKRNDPRQGGGKVDLPRMEEGGLDAIFFAVFLGQGERTPEGNERARVRALELFDGIHQVVKKHSDRAELALTPADAYAIEKKAKRAIFIGIENGYPIGQDLGLLQEYYDLGARYVTLCHTKNNDICDSSTDKTEHGGLSAFGAKVVAEMNRLGMLIDVSHISDDSFYDVLRLSRAPVFASHSCARAICDNPRNLDDAMLKKLAENDGVIQMCILSAYVKEPAANPEREAAIEAVRATYDNYSALPEEEKARVRKAWDELNRNFPRKLASVSEAVDHIDHIVKVAGIDHVGIGSDFDGGGDLADCYDVSEMGNITLELVRRGYTEAEIRKIWAGNFMRVYSRVIAVGEKLRPRSTREIDQ